MISERGRKMRLSEYQQACGKTDACGEAEEPGRLVALLGIAGEAAGLLSEYKKLLRDGQSMERFRSKVAEELGDVLWYVASAARRFEFDLEAIARANLEKVAQRFGDRAPDGSRVAPTTRRVFDEGFPSDERLPRKFEAVWTTESRDGKPVVDVTMNGKPFGDALDDNAATPDGFRYHDALHFGFAACLGWSPQVRKFCGRKRKSDPKFDRIEDGARARFAEEAVVVLVHAYAAEHEDLRGVKALDSALLQTIRGVVRSLEVGIVPEHEWERAILDGYSVFNSVREAGTGRAIGDLDEGTIKFEAS